MAEDSSYRYVAEVSTGSGEHLGNLSLAPDFGSAVDWSHWEGVRRGRLAPVSPPPAATIAPVWDAGQGPPYVEALRVQFNGEGTEPFSREIPKLYLLAAAEVASRELVTSGKLAAGDRFSFRVCAFPEAPPRETAVSDGELTVEPVTESLHIEAGELAPLLAKARPQGELDPKAEQMPVFIPEHVLVETRALAIAAGDVESGGVLVGRMCRAAERDEVFMEITAHIPAQHTLAEYTSLRFTPATWAAVDAALALRGGGEQILGWYHHHPPLCNPECPQERRRLCPFSKPFFSEADRSVHRAVFPRSYSVALLLSFFETDNPSYDLFGWHQGMIHHRGFYVLAQDGALTRAVGPDNAARKN